MAPLFPMHVSFAANSVTLGKPSIMTTTGTTMHTHNLRHNCYTEMLVLFPQQ